MYTIKWEYMEMEHTADSPPLIDWLNRLGAVGWELVVVVNRRVSSKYIFKRGERQNA